MHGLYDLVFLLLRHKYTYDSMHFTRRHEQEKVFARGQVVHYLSATEVVKAVSLTFMVVLKCQTLTIESMPGNPEQLC